jgi:hypothetical protein
MTGSTKISYPTSGFSESLVSRVTKLGSGIVFVDDAIGMKEIVVNAHRIDAFRKTSSYHYCVLVRPFQ